MILNKIFSIEKNKDRIIYKFLGLKLKTKFFDKKNYNLFLKHEIEPKTILIIEINDCHMETIMGYSKYLIELGYNVDIIIRGDAESAFSSINKDFVNIFEVGKIAFDKIFKFYDFSKYERIIYNSKRVYFKKNDIDGEGLDIEEYYNSIPSGKNENIYIQHHIDKINEFYKHNQIVLANPSKKVELNKYVVNPHYFGEFKLKNFKNKNIVNFISIGELSYRRRNSSLLISIAQNLHNLGVSNFKITIIGRGEIDAINYEIQKYFNILGRVDYQTLFKKLNEADYILPLLDPEIEFHKRYIESGTSGIFQLVYGFNKPCIIHKIFADVYGFDEKNSVVYEDNNKLLEAIQKAICIGNEEYKLIQNNLAKTTKDIKDISVKNLQNILME